MHTHLFAKLHLKYRPAPGGIGRVAPASHRRRDGTPARVTGRQGRWRRIALLDTFDPAFPIATPEHTGPAPDVGHPGNSDAGLRSRIGRYHRLSVEDPRA